MVKQHHLRTTQNKLQLPLKCSVVKHLAQAAISQKVLIFHGNLPSTDNKGGVHTHEKASFIMHYSMQHHKRNSFVNDILLPFSN